MLPRPRPAVAIVMSVLVALVALVLTGPSADAAVARVAGVTKTGQYADVPRLAIRWTKVPGATYQVRWSGSRKGIARARVSTVAVPRATSPSLARCGATWVQVRAVRHHRPGPWSQPLRLTFVNKPPARPRLSGVGLPGAVRLTWPRAVGATRYQLRWNAAPYGSYPGGDRLVEATWLPATRRSAPLVVSRTPRPGDKMMGVAYANPVFARLVASNVCLPSRTRSTSYVPVFPKAPDPGPGDPLRVGAYNVELFPTNETAPGRIDGLVANIAARHLDVLTLQEAFRQTAGALQSKLPSTWEAVPPQPAAAQQIFYDRTRFQLVANGVFDVPNPRPDSHTLPTPWARLRLLKPSGTTSQDVLITSVHLGEDPARSAMDKKRDAMLATQLILRELAAVNPDRIPVVVAGDLRYGRAPYSDVPGYVEAQPTLVRAGYYDAMAAVLKRGIAYPTVNQHLPQVPVPSGVAARADYILVKGFRGSRAYTNVANWTYRGQFVSDHNLVYADLTLPFAR